MSTKFKLDNLDSIRTIAFVSTFFAHAFYTTSMEVEQSNAFIWLNKFREVFSFGVPIFFVLSGFLITYLMFKEQEDTGEFSVKNFYVRRVLRIWPVYYLVLIVGFVLFPLLRNYVLHAPYVETANPWYYMFFLSNFDQINQNVLPYGVGLGPTWSVSVEEQFYLFWPLLFLFFRKKNFIWAMLAVLASSVFFTGFYGLPSKHLIYCMTYLSIGGIYAYLSFYHRGFIQRIVKIHPVIFLIICFSLFGGIYLSSLGYGNFLNILIIAIIIGYIIVFQAFSGSVQFKKIPFLETLGKYTYGLYLYHVICNFFAHVLVDDIFKAEETTWTVIVVRPLISMALSIGLSILSYHYFEKYFLKLKKKYSRS